MTSNRRTWGLVLMSTIALGGCQTVPGPYNGLGRDGASMILVHKNPDYGPMTAEEYGVVTDHANSCLVDGRRQMASLGETSGTMAAVGAVSGSISGSVVTQFIPGGRTSVYGPYIGTMGAINGATGGLAMQSSAMTNFVGGCTNGDLSDPLTREKVPGVHAYPAPVRSNNRTGRVPPWITAAPASE